MGVVLLPFGTGATVIGSPVAGKTIISTLVGRSGTGSCPETFQGRDSRINAKNSGLIGVL
jgi:hypothetical protein